MDEAAFVERRFELDGAALVAAFFGPAAMPTGEYRCRWTIGWPARTETGHASGEDGVQALMLALQMAHDALTGSEAGRNGRMTLWGQADPDLPPGWGSRPLYHIPPLPFRTPKTAP